MTNFKRTAIHFVPNEVVENLKKRNSITTVYEGGKQLDDIKKIDTNGLTTGVRYCLAGLFGKDKDDLMYHFYHEDFLPNAENITEEISKINPLEKLDIFLFGGYSKKTEKGLNEEKSISSLRILSKLKESLTDFKNKNLNVFYGQKTENISDSSSINIFYDKPQKDIYLSIEEETGLDSGIYFENEIPLSLKSIKNHFKFIQVSPEVDVFINTKKVDNELLNSVPATSAKNHPSPIGKLK